MTLPITKRFPILLALLGPTFVAEGVHALQVATLDRSAQAIEPAVRLGSEGAREEAVAWLEAYLRSNPQNGYAWFRLGVEHESSREWQTAADAYRRASDFVPFAVWGLHQAAAMHARAGDPDRAVAELREALRRGYADHEEIVDDPDFGSLATYAPFRHLIDEMRTAPYPRMDRHSSWSPRGDSIVFSSSREGEGSWSLFIVAVDGTGLRRLTHTYDDDFQPAWSPDGEWIAFTRDGAYSGREVYRIRTDGSGLSRLTGPGRAVEVGLKGFAEWMLTEDRLLLAVEGAAAESGIYLVAGDGSEAERLSDGGAWPSATPEGDVIYDDGRLFRVPRGGGRPEPLTGGERITWWASAVSPDGQAVASSVFARGGRLNQLAVTSLSDGSMTVLTAPQFDAFMPSWSPDGEHLVFALGAHAFGHGGRTLHIVRRDGSGLRPLVVRER